MKTDMQTILNRLERVENQNRALKWAGVALLVLILFASFWGQAASKKNVVKGEEFVLLDDQGRYRAVLEVTNSGPSFRFLDERGEKLFEIPPSRDLEFADPPNPIR